MGDVDAWNPLAFTRSPTVSPQLERIYSHLDSGLPRASSDTILCIRDPQPHEGIDDVLETLMDLPPTLDPNHVELVVARFALAKFLLHHKVL